MSELPQPLQAILDLFATEFADVHFADIDAATLARLTAEVHAASDAATAAQVVLDDARALLQERREALLQHAHRALAYARVYAENDDALTARLEAIALPRLARRTRSGAAGDASEVLVLSPDPESTNRRRARTTSKERVKSATMPTTPALLGADAVAAE